MCCRAFPQTGIVVLTAEILDVVVFLVEVEVEITAALGAFQPPGEHARLLGNSRLLTACTFLHGLHLFPCSPVNDRLMDIEKDSSVFLGIFNAPFHFVGFGIALEVNDIAAVFLQGENFLDGGMSPFGRLQRAFGATAVDALAPPIVGGIDDAIRSQSVCNFRQSIPLQGHIIDTPHYISGFRVNHPKPGIVRVFDIAIGRLGQRDARGSFHLIDDFPLFRDVFRIPLVHDIAEWGKFVVTLVTVHTVRYGD